MTTMHDVESSNIAQIGYDEALRLLHVRFTQSGTYVYHDVPQEVFDGLMSADSKGWYLNTMVKGTYKFSKLEEPAPAEEHLTLTMTRPVFEILQRFLECTPLNADDGSVVNLRLAESASGVMVLETVVHRGEQ